MTTGGSDRLRVGIERELRVELGCIGLGAQAQSDVISQAVQAHAGSRRCRGSERRRAPPPHPPRRAPRSCVTWPSRSSCRRTPAVRTPGPRRRPDHEREIEAHAAVRRAAVEVQPLRPGRGEFGDVGRPVEAVHRAQHAGWINRGPARVSGRIRPRRDAAPLPCRRRPSPGSEYRRARESARPFRA